MWPWEHLAVGYLLYSALARVGGRRPGRDEALLLAVGTQFPDLVDKPLGWVLGVLPGGLTVAHSLLFALPFVALVLVATRGTSLQRGGLAFAVGYGSHLPADALYNWLVGGRAFPSFLLWPLLPATPTDYPSLADLLQGLLAKYVTFLVGPTGRLYLTFEVALLVAAAAAWWADGHPGVGVVARRSPDPGLER